MRKLDEEDEVQVAPSVQYDDSFVTSSRSGSSTITALIKRKKSTKMEGERALFRSGVGKKISPLRKRRARRLWREGHNSVRRAEEVCNGTFQKEPET